MMPELSLHILDVAQNSIKAGANFIQIMVDVSFQKDALTIHISDNGCGMTKEMVNKVFDPFYTTRTTRNIGLGIPFFEYAAKATGGTLTIDSIPCEGTKLTAIFVLSHIDRMPLGDLASTMHTLITLNTNIDFYYTYQVNGKHFTLNTMEFREILGDVSFDLPDISRYIKEYLVENHSDINEGQYI
ncbi:MAG: ATP-binding protein [Anaerocolumna sp.]